MATRAKTKLEDRHEQKRLMILSVAAKAFNEKGYHNTTMDEVCTLLNMSKPTVYYYLRNKDDLLFECSRIATTQLHEAIEKAREEGRDGWEKLKGIFFGYAEVMTTDFGKCLVLTEPTSLSEESHNNLWSGRRRLNKEVREIIQEGIADGSIAPCDPKLVSYALFGAFNWIPRWYAPDGPLTPMEIAESFFEVFGRGLLPDRASGKNRESDGKTNEKSPEENGGS